MALSVDDNLIFDFSSHISHSSRMSRWSDKDDKSSIEAKITKIHDIIL
jgi:hypothetical protein